MATWQLTNIHAAIEQELDMNEWLIENNLTSIQHFVIKHNLTLDELEKYDNADAEFVEIIHIFQSQSFVCHDI